jgi:putative PEP-CTERM system TPR-repeat lipoprotein
MLLAVVLFAGGCADYVATPEQLIASAKQKRDKGEYTSAIIQLKSALQKAPENAEARFLMGATFNDVGEFKAAEIELRRALELRYDLAKVEIGKSLLMMREYRKVLDDVPMDANVGNAVQAEILTLRGVASIALGRGREGREMLEQALVKQPEFANALLAQARIAIGENKVEEASQLIERAVASAPKNVDAWLIKGDLSEYKGDSAGALAAYQKVVEISAENIPAQAKLTQFEIYAGNFDEARKRLAQLRKISPGNPLINYLLALLEFRQKKFTAARDAVQLALKAAPDSLPILQLTGIIEYALGAHAQAQAHLLRVVERVPRALGARKLLIASLMKTGQLQRAVEMLQPGLLQAPEDGELMTLAGEVYLQKKRLAQGRAIFRNGRETLSEERGCTHGPGNEPVILG